MADSSKRFTSRYLDSAEADTSRDSVLLTVAVVRVPPVPVEVPRMLQATNQSTMYCMQALAAVLDLA